MELYAYGGAGGAGGRGDSSSQTAGGGGGYPAAGIGGGGSGGAGGTCCAGAGGYTGGSGDSDEIKAENGLAGSNGHHCSGELLAGGGYFQGGYGLDINGNNRQILALGGVYNQGHHPNLSDASGSGGIAGSGGNVSVSENSKIYAFNGNLYTDGTDYLDGINQCPIYLQSGIKVAKYTYRKYNNSNYCTFDMILNSSQEISVTSGYINNLYMINSEYINNKILNINTVLSVTDNPLSNVDMSKQGIGSGAGYIEVSNGTYAVDSSMN